MLTVHLRITDAATNKPVPVRVRVTGPDGAQYAPLGRSAEFAGGRNEDVGGHLRVGRERWFYIDGACEVSLPAGVPIRVQAAKGPEWTPLDTTVTLGVGQISLRFTIARWTDSRAENWASVDTRCHFISPHAALLEAQAEGLDAANVLATPIPVLTMDANTYTTTPNLLAFSGQVSALERIGHAVFVNTFNTHPVLGKVALLNSHRPVFPLTFGGEDSDDWGVCDWADQCHRKGGLVVWVDAFESAGGVTGGESLVAAILGKIDAIEVCAKPRKAPLLPWVYRLWNAGVLVPLVGASGKDSNAIQLGAMRTYARVREEPLSPTPFPDKGGGGRHQDEANGDDSSLTPPPLSGKGVGERGSSWVESIRAGCTFVSAGPLLTLVVEGQSARANLRSPLDARVEIVANGEVVASGDRTAEVTLSEPGWVAVRATGSAGFAHTSSVAVGPIQRQPEAVTALRALIEQTREWIETQGRFANPKRKQTLLDRCTEAARKLEG